MTDKRQLRNRKRDLPEEVSKHIEIEFLSGKGPTEIFRELEALYPPKKWDKMFPGYDRLQLRTIQRICSDLKIKDSSAVWQLQNEEFTPEQALCILKVLQCVIRRTGGRKRTFTNNEARWIARIGQTAPSLYQPGRLWLLWLLAHLYLLHESKQKPTEALDSYLSFEAWNGASQWQKYTQAIKQEYISPVPLSAVLVGEGPYLDILDAEFAGHLERSIRPLVERYQQLKQKGYTDDQIAEKLDKEREERRQK